VHGSSGAPGPLVHPLLGSVIAGSAHAKRSDAIQPRWPKGCLFKGFQRRLPMWSSIASAGVGSAADLAQLVFSGPAVQFGVNAPSQGATSSPTAVRSAIVSRREATLRYPVNLDGLAGISLSRVSILMNCRRGDGSVRASLNSIGIESSGQPDPSVTEIFAVSSDFETDLTPSDPNVFLALGSLRNFDDSNVFVFDTTVYYVEVVFSRGDIAIEGLAPALSLVALKVAPPTKT
jgi:hypothetical protein